MSQQTVTEKRTVISSSSSAGYDALEDIPYKPNLGSRSNIISRSSFPSSHSGSSQIMRTVEYGYGSSMGSGGMGLVGFSNVSNTGVNNVKSTREKEKKDLRDLNERFANYIEKVRFLEAQNRKLGGELDELRSKWGKETSHIKQMYEAELAEARKLIDDLSKDKAALEIKSSSIQEQNADLQRQLDEAKRFRLQDRETINKLNQQLADYESEINMLRRSIESLETERQRDKGTINRLQQEVDKLRIDLNNETLAHLDAENRRQTLEEEMEFMKKVHEQELKELAALAYRDTTAENREFWKSELAQAIRDIQAEYDAKVDQIRGDMEGFYNLKIQEYRTGATKQNMEVTHIREENKKLVKQMSDLRGKLTDLEARNAQLEKQYTDVLRELESKDTDHMMECTQLREEISKLRAEMEGILTELQTLMDAKLSLELEIAAYRKLLEGEENRIDWRSRAGMIMYRDAFRPRPSYERSTRDEAKEKPIEPKLEVTSSAKPEPRDASPDTDAASSITMSDQEMSPKDELAETDIADVVVEDEGKSGGDSKTLDSSDDANKDTIHDSMPVVDHVVTVKEEVQKIEKRNADAVDGDDDTQTDNNSQVEHKDESYKQEDLKKVESKSETKTDVEASGQTKIEKEHIEEKQADTLEQVKSVSIRDEPDTKEEEIKPVAAIASEATKPEKTTEIADSQLESVSISEQSISASKQQEVTEISSDKQVTQSKELTMADKSKNVEDEKTSISEIQPEDDKPPVATSQEERSSPKEDTVVESGKGENEKVDTDSQSPLEQTKITETQTEDDRPSKTTSKEELSSTKEQTVVESIKTDQEILAADDHLSSAKTELSETQKEHDKQSELTGKEELSSTKEQTAVEPLKGDKETLGSDGQSSPDQIDVHEIKPEDKKPSEITSKEELSSNKEQPAFEPVIDEKETLDTDSQSQPSQNLNINESKPEKVDAKEIESISSTETVRDSTSDVTTENKEDKDKDQTVSLGKEAISHSTEKLETKDETLSAKSEDSVVTEIESKDSLVTEENEIISTRDMAEAKNEQTSSEPSKSGLDRGTETAIESAPKDDKQDQKAEQKSETESVKVVDTKHVSIGLEETLPEKSQVVKTDGSDVQELQKGDIESKEHVIEQKDMSISESVHVTEETGSNNEIKQSTDSKDLSDSLPPGDTSKESKSVEAVTIQEKADKNDDMSPGTATISQKVDKPGKDTIAETETNESKDAVTKDEATESKLLHTKPSPTTTDSTDGNSKVIEPNQNVEKVKLVDQSPTDKSKTETAVDTESSKPKTEDTQKQSSVQSEIVTTEPSTHDKDEAILSVKKPTSLSPEAMGNTEDKVLETVVKSKVIEKSPQEHSLSVEASPTKELPDPVSGSPFYDQAKEEATTKELRPQTEDRKQEKPSQIEINEVSKPAEAIEDDKTPDDDDQTQSSEIPKDHPQIAESTVKSESSDEKIPSVESLEKPTSPLKQQIEQSQELQKDKLVQKLENTEDAQPVEQLKSDTTDAKDASKLESSQIDTVTKTPSPSPPSPVKHTSSPASKETTSVAGDSKTNDSEQMGKDDTSAKIVTDSSPSSSDKLNGNVGSDKVSDEPKHVTNGDIKVNDAKEISVSDKKEASSDDLHQEPKTEPTKDEEPKSEPKLIQDDVQTSKPSSEPRAGITEKIEKILINGEELLVSSAVASAVSAVSSVSSASSTSVSEADTQLSMKMMRGEVSAKTTYQRTSTGPIAISEVAADGKYIVLENTSSGPKRQDVNLDGWKLKRTVDGSRDYTYNFKNFTLKAGRTVKIVARSAASEAGLNDLVFRDEDSWGYGSQVKTSLINDKGDEKASHVQKTLYN